MTLNKNFSRIKVFVQKQTNQNTFPMKKIFTLFISLLTFSFSLLGQTGSIHGVVQDNSNQELLPFSNFYIIETKTGGSTDLDGAFNVNLKPGVYSIRLSFVGYKEQVKEGIVVKEGETTDVNFSLVSDAAVLKEVVVKAEIVKNTESAILSLQKKSLNLIDGISNQSFRKIGDNNVASAVSRVTGVSVENGKYVYVRGLGDRYTKSLLNGLDVPGLDPDRNSIQMDLFPTAVIDNIIIRKSALAELPGDFTGGLVDITTKEMPVEKVFNVTVGMDYSPLMSLNKNYLSYQGSKTDFLGFDNGLRNLPIDKNLKIPAAITGNSSLTDITKQFNTTMGARTQTSPINYNFGFTLGNQFTKKNGAVLGYNLVLNYRNITNFFENVEMNAYIKPINSKGNGDLTADKILNGSLGKNTVLLSGLVGGAIKWNSNKISLNFLRIQNGESAAGQFNQANYISSSNNLVKNNLEYTQKSITNLLLKGKHQFADGIYQLDWAFSPTISTINDKDARLASFRVENGVYSIEPSEGAEPRRIWRNLKEIDYSGKIDLLKNYSNRYGENKIKIGIANTYKDRNYEILGYRINVKNQSSLNIKGDPNKLLLPENIWTVETGTGTYLVGNYEPANTYNASQNIAAAYIQDEHQLSQKLKAVLGIRVEKFDHVYTGQNNSGNIIYINKKLLSNINYLPSLNLIYALNPEVNVRFTAARTLARPSFKELSIAQIYDALTDRTFIGNPNLKITDIDNFDLRIEKFGKRDQMVSVSPFYKNFNNPIEVVAFSQVSPNDIQPRNVENAKVYGAEVEFRNDFGFISERLTPLKFVFNFTGVKSVVQMTEAEYVSRLENAIQNEQVKNTRTLQGQSPYLINAILNYNLADKGLDINMSYNVQGKRLSIVGIGRNPDVYEMPFNSLNIKVSKEFGKFSVSATAKNLLNAKILREYVSYNASPVVYDSFKPGSNFGLNLGYRF